MKKHFLLFIVFFFLCDYADAQNIFSREYSLAPLSYSSSANVKPTSDSGFVVTYAIRDVNNSQAYGSMLLKFDKTGNLSWTKYLYHIINGSMDIVEYAGGYLATGATSDAGIHLFKLNKNGDIVSKKTFKYGAGLPHQGFSIHMLNSKDVIISGNYATQLNGDPYVAIIKTDTVGNYKWAYQYPSSWTGGYSIMDQKGNMVTSFGSNTGNEVFGVDTTGHINYHLQLDNASAYWSIGLASNRDAYLITSKSNDSNFVFKINKTGIIDWHSNYLNMRINNMIAYKNGFLLAGAYVTQEKTYGSSLAQMDANGNVQWHILLDAGTATYSYSTRIVELKSKQFVVVSFSPEKIKASFLNHPNVLPCGSEDIPIISTKGFLNYTTLSNNDTPTSFSVTTTNTSAALIHAIKDSLICQAFDTTIRAFKSASICNGDSILLANKYRRAGGVYSDSLVTGTGRDSVISTLLVINPTYDIKPKVSICEGDSVLIHGQYRKKTGVFTDNTHSVMGCDSATTTTLTVNALPETPTISRSCNTLSSSPSNAYQWFRNDTLISDANKISFPFKKIGRYAVAVKDANGCNGLSSQFEITELLPTCMLDLVALPNPYNESITIRYTLLESKQITLEVYNVLGERISTLISNEQQAMGQHTYLFSSGTSGVYMLYFKMDNFIQVIRLVKI